eukprot:TRINITY_DN7105_c0_g2_i1.p1 TRINITY_DN7105_c0_g2~~TRINITY_DN7105_c0_g2_i1.p1  ORF type:complete len:576 (-),score=88.87 TRINITY_DN7105_c0_g2_i1:409-2136(-)
MCSLPEAFCASGNEDFGLPSDRFRLVRELQQGGQGSVHTCVRLNTSNEYAVKVIRAQALRKNKRNEVMLRREIRTLRELQHPKLVNLHAAFWEDGSCFIVMDLAREGDMADRVVKGKGIGSDALSAEYASRYVAHQVLDGMQYMHRRRVIHRDLKVDNVLISKSREAPSPYACRLYDIKIADFGLSTWLDIVGEVLTPVGTPKYVAPEISYDNYDERVDFFSFGVVVFVMLCGDFPFAQLDSDGTIKQHSKIKETQAWNQVSEQARSIVRGLLQFDPNDRLNPGSCLAHPWLQVDIPPKETDEPPQDSDTFVRVPSTVLEGDVCGAIEHVCGWAGCAVDNLILTMRGGRESKSFGSIGGFRAQNYRLKPNEMIVAVAQETRVQMPQYLGNAVVFYTSEANILAVVGTDARRRNRFIAPPGSQIVGLQFCETLLTGIYLERAPSGDPGAVAQIGGKVGASVDRIDLRLRDGTCRSYGTGGGWQQGPWNLEPGEIITVVEQARRDAYLGNSVAFYTSAGRIIKLAGMESSWSRRYSAPVGMQLCGFVFEGAMLTHVMTCPHNVAHPRPHEIEQHETD